MCTEMRLELEVLPKQKMQSCIQVWPLKLSHINRSLSHKILGNKICALFVIMIILFIADHIFGLQNIAISDGIDTMRFHVYAYYTNIAIIALDNQ